MHREPVNGRKAINGLALLVEQALGLNPFEPAIYVFSNRRRDRIKLLHRLYAAKSEARANLAQRDLFLNEAEALAPNAAPVAEETTPEAVEVAGHSRKKRGRKPLDPLLPREIVRHELAEAERICAHDGTRLVEIDANISEQLDIVPQQIHIIQYQRIKYACPCCDNSIRITPPPARIYPQRLTHRTRAGLSGEGGVVYRLRCRH
ncbi:IS66 family transposase zinc-finger binding domain-containing protein [Methylomonas sp. 2B]|uniref:IS66 family transposase zinc-finger binding domain-containing protein n=1 Tax=Methylomonas sp. 2B TaxID=3367743 RepID=UPI0037CC036C